MKTATSLGLLFLAVLTPSHAGNTRVVTVQPTVTGTLTFFPVLDNLFVQGVDLQSTCFDTTGQNLEWRRAFAEFELPAAPARIVRATLQITEPNTGWSAFPLPTDVHEVSLYPGDLVVDPSDYDVPTLLVGTIETDANDDPVTRSFEFDVTQAIRQMAKQVVGVRIKLQIDPTDPCVEFQHAGSDFGSLFADAPTLLLEIEKGKKKGRD
jgi:hypothetical protein